MTCYQYHFHYRLNGFLYKVAIANYYLHNFIEMIQAAALLAWGIFDLEIK